MNIKSTSNSADPKSWTINYDKDLVPYCTKLSPFLPFVNSYANYINKRQPDFIPKTSLALE